MKLAVIGVNYNNTPIDIREKVSFTKSKKIKASEYLLHMGIEEVCILSTCNRSEIYVADVDIKSSINKVKEFFKVFFNVPNIEKYLFIKEDREVVSHIFNVASGLQSMILCEDQILGQVKEVLEFSIENNYSKKILNKLFREAITAGKRIKSELKISENPISMVYISIKLLKKDIGDLKGKRACVIGMGEMGRLALKHLASEGLEEIFVANRTYNNVLDLIHEFPSIKPIEYEKRYTLLNSIDILITATSSPHIIIDYEHIKEIKKQLYIIDLAVPRDVERRVRDLNNIHLYDVDDFKNISDDNIKRREELSQAAKKIIAFSIEDFILWIKGLNVEEVIKDLNKRCNEIKDEYFGYIDDRLDLDSKEKEVIEKMLSSALKRLIKEPVLKLKEIDDEDLAEEYSKVINKLFYF
jgi:glutamyl-tRNA reductase